MKPHLLSLFVGVVVLASCQKNLTPDNAYLEASEKASLAAKVQEDPLLKEFCEVKFKSGTLQREGMKAPTFKMEEFKAQTQKVNDAKRSGESSSESYSATMTKILTASGFGNVEGYVASLDKERDLHLKLFAKYPGLSQFDGKEWVQLLKPVMSKVYESNGMKWYDKPSNL